MAKLTVCVFMILVLLVALSEGSSMRLCCTEYQDRPVPVKALKSYRMQDTSYCNLKAAIFRTARNKLFCANPDSEWVQKAMKTVPEKLSSTEII